MDIKRYKKLFFVDELVYYKSLLDEISELLYPYYKNGFKVVRYEGELCGLKVPEGFDIGCRERKEIINLTRQFVEADNKIKQLEVGKSRR